MAGSGSISETLGLYDVLQKTYNVDHNPESFPVSQARLSNGG